MFKLEIQTNNYSNHLCRNWVFVQGGCGSRLVNGILGLLCREHFLGMVELSRKTESAYTYAHYVAATDREYGNKAEWVKAELWVSLACTKLLNTSHSLDIS